MAPSSTRFRRLREANALAQGVLFAEETGRFGFFRIEPISVSWFNSSNQEF